MTEDGGGAAELSRAGAITTETRAPNACPRPEQTGSQGRKRNQTGPGDSSLTREQGSRDVIREEAKGSWKFSGSWKLQPLAGGLMAWMDRKAMGDRSDAADGVALGPFSSCTTAGSALHLKVLGCGYNCLSYFWVPAAEWTGGWRVGGVVELAEGGS